MIHFLLRNSGWILLFSVLTGLIGGLGAAGLIATINIALDHGQDRFIHLGGIYIGLCFLLIMARVISAFLFMRIGQNVIFDLRLKLSRQVLRAPFSRLQKVGAARILACLTQDVVILAETFRWLPMLCVNLAIVAGCLIYLGWLSKALLVLVLFIILVGVGGFRLIENRALHGLTMAREYDDALYGHFRSLTQGIKELKLHELRRNAFLSDYLEFDANNYRQQYLKGNSYFIVANNWGNGLFYLLLGSVLFLLPYGPEYAVKFSQMLEVDVSILPVWPELGHDFLRGYCLTILFMMSPLAALVDGLPLLAKGNIALKKIETLGMDSSEPELTTPGASLVVSNPTVLKLKGVTHQYRREDEDHSFNLGPIDLTVQPGEVVFLTGGNGSGKTTLALLLVGLYTPEQGCVELGGQLITEVNRESYRQQFSAVFSDFYLFDSLLGFHGEGLDVEARAYLARLQLSHKVQIEEGVFSTLDLSQGQRKRLALLVAYLEDRPFYLFDEWAADQDPVFKKVFYTEILPALKDKGKTVIVISHDELYFYMADRCLKIVDGMLAEKVIVK